MSRSRRAETMKIVGSSAFRRRVRETHSPPEGGTTNDFPRSLHVALRHPETMKIQPQINADVRRSAYFCVYPRPTFSEEPSCRVATP